MTEKKPIDVSKHVCVKCGHIGHSIRYDKISWPGFDFSIGEAYEKIYEVIVVSCHACGYMFNIKPLDMKKEKETLEKVTEDFLKRNHDAVEGIGDD